MKVYHKKIKNKGPKLTRKNCQVMTHRPMEFDELQSVIKSEFNHFFFYISIVHKNRLNLVEVDYSRFVAHLRRFVVVAPDCRESHLGVGGAH